MYKTLTKKEKTRFEVINKYNVAIMSLKNQLKNASSIDELTILASRIINLEQQILVEKSTGYKELEQEKKKVETKIDKLTRELKQAENDLNRIDNNIDLKLNGYRAALQAKIEGLTNDFNNMQELILQTANI
jgi:hypothetical protein